MSCGLSSGSAIHSVFITTAYILEQGTKQKGPTMSFWSKVIEQNYRMWLYNSEITPQNDSVIESHPIKWPLMQHGHFLTLNDTTSHTLYMTGNPVVWRMSFILLFFAGILYFLVAYISWGISRMAGYWWMADKLCAILFYWPGHLYAPLSTSLVLCMFCLRNSSR